MKNFKLIKVGFVGIVLIMISTLTYGQKIEAKYRQKLEEAKKTNGIELFEDGTVKVKINTKLLEHIYNAYDENDVLSWRELVNSSETQSFADIWNTYRTTNDTGVSYAELRKDHEKQDNEIAEKRNNENDIQNIVLAEKNQEEQIITHIID